MLLLGPLVVTLGLRHVRSAARIVGAHRRPADVRCRTLVACARDPPAIITNLESIAAEYDVLLLDQFGVMHDGKRALPGAIECFDRLAAAGKRLVVLSNTSRRRAFAMKKLPSLGFPAEKLSGFVCSGEEAWQHMAAGWRGKRALWFSWAEDFHAWEPDWLEGLNILNIHLSSAADADFIICQGTYRRYRHLDDISIISQNVLICLSLRRSQSLSVSLSLSQSLSASLTLSHTFSHTFSHSHFLSHFSLPFLSPISLSTCSELLGEEAPRYTPSTHTLDTTPSIQPPSIRHLFQPPSRIDGDAH